MLMIIGSILLAVAGIFGLIILINAFKQGALQGILCMFVPFYILYFAFAKYQGKKGLVVGGYLGSAVLGTALFAVGSVMAANEAAAALNADLAALEATDFANPPAAGAAAADEPATTMHCDLSQQPGRLCNEYRVTASYTRENAAQHCEMVQIVADEKQPLADGSCPTENAVAKCEPRFGNNTTFYYRDDTPGVDQNAQLSSMETLCVGTFTRL